MKALSTKWFVLAGFVLGGCAVDASLDVPSVTGEPTGTLTQRWSIGGRFNASLCRTYRADKMELVIRDTNGRIVARAYQPCEEMQMTVDLPVGSYDADATLIASNGADASTTLELARFRILRNTDTFIDTDFPVSSLLMASNDIEQDQGDATHFTLPNLDALWKLPIPKMGDHATPPLFCMA